MRTMIREYERCRAALSKRIRSLNSRLRNDPMLRTKEREAIERRRDLLSDECTELLHAIVSMRGHCHSEGEERDADKGIRTGA